MADLVARELVEGLRRELLQPGLVVVPAGSGRALDDARLEQPQHELAGGVPSTVEVDGGDHGLHGVGEDRRLVASARRFLPLAEEQRPAQLRFAGDLGEHLTVDDRGSQLGQLAFRHVGVLGDHVVGDDEPEHGVAEELEALVRQRVGMLGAVRAVRERPLDQLGVAELEPEHGIQTARPGVLPSPTTPGAHRQLPSRATT